MAGDVAWSFMSQSWPLRIMGIVSMPAIRMRAHRKVLNPSVDRVIRLMARRSCSTMLLRYFDWRSSMAKPLSAWKLTMAAVLEPLLSIVMFSGRP